MKSKAKLHPDVVISVVALLFSLVLLFEIHGYPEEVKLFPRIFIYLFMAFMAITLFRGVRKTLAPERADSSEWWCRFETVKDPMITAAFVVVYVALIGLLGFYVSTALYLLGSMRYFGSKSWKVNIAVAAGMIGFCYVLFSRALSVTLPVGMLFKAILG